MREPSGAVQFACQLTRELKKVTPYHVAIMADELMRLSRKHHRIMEGHCNGDYDIPEDAHQPEDKIEAKITEIMKPFGITPIFSGDPRGCTVKLKMPSGATNDFGHTGVCVPQ